jgi:hypothetical protein
VSNPVGLVESLHTSSASEERTVVENEDLTTDTTYVDTGQLPPVRYLTHEEAWQMFDRQARHHFDMTGEEFIRAWESGEFDDDPDAPNVQWVAMMMTEPVK